MRSRKRKLRKRRGQRSIKREDVCRLIRSGERSVPSGTRSLICCHLDSREDGTTRDDVATHVTRDMRTVGIEVESCYNNKCQTPEGYIESNIKERGGSKKALHRRW